MLKEVKLLKVVELLKEMELVKGVESVKEVELLKVVTLSIQSIMAASAEQHTWHASPPDWSYRIPALSCCQFPYPSSELR